MIQAPLSRRRFAGALGAALGAAILSTLVAAGFGAIPARRAAEVDPATSLRGA